MLAQLLQWGRRQLPTETESKAIKDPAFLMLQWGRRQLPTETDLFGRFSWRASSLQWGRRQLPTETTVVRGTRCSAERSFNGAVDNCRRRPSSWCASVCCQRRFNGAVDNCRRRPLLCEMLTQATHRLQWGRRQLPTETASTVSPFFGFALLQWGRRQLPTETAKMVSPIPCALRLQWGRRQLPTETGVAFRARGSRP